jgi:hypothetical protein
LKSKVITAKNRDAALKQLPYTVGQRAIVTKIQVLVNTGDKWHFQIHFGVDETREDAEKRLAENPPKPNSFNPPITYPSNASE